MFMVTPFRRANTPDRRKTQEDLTATLGAERSALPMTETELKLMAAAAIIGLNRSEELTNSQQSARHGRHSLQPKRLSILNVAYRSRLKRRASRGQISSTKCVVIAAFPEQVQGAC